MPQKINMFISNGNYSQQQIQKITTSNLASYNNKPSALNSSIIARIHNVRPGCGSCGRK